MTFKVFDLACDNNHVFEGWFRSHDDYDTQQQRGLLTCPLCNSSNISKQLSAPYVATPKETRPSAVTTQHSSSSPTLNDAPPPTDTTQLKALQAALLEQIKSAVNNTENVGTRFAEEAKRIHEGDAKARPIRGIATPQERDELLNEGIDIIGIPDFLDDKQLQ